MRSKRRIPDEELLKDLIRVMRRLGKEPSVREYDRIGNYNFRSYYNHFGSFERAKELAKKKAARRPQRREKHG